MLLCCDSDLHCGRETTAGAAGAEHRAVRPGDGGRGLGSHPSPLHQLPCPRPCPRKPSDSWKQLGPLPTRRVGVGLLELSLGSSLGTVSRRPSGQPTRFPERYLASRAGRGKGRQSATRAGVWRRVFRACCSGDFEISLSGGPCGLVLLPGLPVPASPRPGLLGICLISLKHRS